MVNVPPQSRKPDPRPTSTPDGRLFHMEAWLRRHGLDHLATGLCFVGLVTSGITEVIKGE